MSKRAKLRDLAEEFRQAPATESKTNKGDDVDLDAEIAKRLAQANGDPRPSSPTTEASKPAIAASQPPAAEAAVPDLQPTKPKSKTRSTTSPTAPSAVDATAPVPRPVVREPGDRSRIALDVPAQFEHIRKSAKKMGMSATGLVLAALDNHGEQLAARAQTGVLPVRSEALKRWTLLMTESELAELDQLVEAVEPGLGRRSRSAVVGLLLSELPD